LSPWWIKTVTHRSKGDLLRKWIPMPLIAEGFYPAADTSPASGTLGENGAKAPAYFR